MTYEGTGIMPVYEMNRSNDGFGGGVGWIWVVMLFFLLACMLDKKIKALDHEEYDEIVLCAYAKAAEAWLEDEDVAEGKAFRYYAKVVMC